MRSRLEIAPIFCFCVEFADSAPVELSWSSQKWSEEAAAKQAANQPAAAAAAAGSAAVEENQPAAAAAAAGAVLPNGAAKELPMWWSAPR